MAASAKGEKMSIEQIVQQAIEEFGEFAHERFTDSKGLNFADNDDLNRELAGWGDIQLKPLPELFAHNVKVYGDDAYLMLQRYNYDSRDVICWINCTSNDDVQLAIDNDNEIRRKQSAALPFDLKRAKAGDAFEYFERGEWHTKTSIDDNFPIDERYLRMKYPRR